MFQIRTYNKISEKGLSLFDPERYVVGEDVGQPDAILLRSQKLHDEPLPLSVQAIARAGAGVNNIPVEDVTRKGIVVFNTPGANANAVKELVIAGLLLSSRGIIKGGEFVQTLGSITDGAVLAKRLEAEKKRFAGSELAGKTLGVIGLGAIGSMVANAGLAMDMRVLGFDPALSVEAAWKLSNRVEKVNGVQALLAEVDYLTLHVPAIDATKNMINEDTLSVMKPNATLLNFAREQVVDGKAVINALSEGRLHRYVCDFPEPGMIGNDKIICLPHIGASTQEAEENCAIMAVNELRDYLENGNIVNSVNFPRTEMARGDTHCRITFTNENVSGVLGHVLSVFAEHDVNVVDMVNKSRGDVAYNILDLADKPSPTVLESIRQVEHVISMRILCDK